MAKKPRPRIRSTFATNIGRLMRASKESQETLAQRAGISQKQVSNVISGASAPTTETAEALARAYGLPAWVLMTRELPPADVQRLALDQLVSDFLDSSPEAQSYILSIARREAKA
jgi:transcriptional regulator with XRE-family HTH domain